MLKQPEQVKNPRFKESRSQFQKKRSISIANKFSSLPQTGVERRLQEAARRSLLFQRIDNDNAMGARGK